MATLRRAPCGTNVEHRTVDGARMATDRCGTAPSDALVTICFIVGGTYVRDSSSDVPTLTQSTSASGSVCPRPEAPNLTSIEWAPAASGAAAARV
jgi:hypothetical protein